MAAGGQEWIQVDATDAIELDDLVMLACLQCRTLVGSIVGSLHGSCPVCAKLPHHGCDLRGVLLTLNDVAAKALGAARVEATNGRVAEAVGRAARYSRVDLNGLVQPSEVSGLAPELRVH